MRSGHTYIFFFLYLFCVTQVAAQSITSLPPNVFSTGESQIRTTFYLPGSNQFMVFDQNKCWVITKEGKITAGPLFLRKDGGDAWHPRISSSGKLVAFQIPGEDLFTDSDKMALYNLDSGYIVGTYDLPTLSDVNRVRFSGDSILQYYLRFLNYKGVTTWHTELGKVRSQSVKENDSLHTGLYDIYYYKDKILSAIRYADSLALVTTFPGTKQQYFDMFKLSDPAVKNWVQFTSGYPYSIVSDESNGQTKISRSMDTSFRLLATLPFIPEIYGASGTEENCFLLYIDTAQKKVPVLTLFDTQSGKGLPLTGFPLPSTGHIYSLYPEQKIFTVSHPANGTITAYYLSGGEFAWTTTPEPPSPAPANASAVPTSDNKLFKVLIKQGTDHVNQSYYDKETNQLYLIKNNDKLITVDADAKGAVRWEQFYKGDKRVSSAQLLPGNRYILYYEEKWEKEEGAEDPDKHKARYQYPYSTLVFDREKARPVFQLQAQNSATVNVINDSLVYWSDGNYLFNTDSISIYNLNNGAIRKERPLPAFNLRSYKIAMINNRLFFALGTDDENLELVDEKGKVHTRRSYPGISNDLVEFINFIPNSPYFYFFSSDKNAVNQLYRVMDDSVKMVRQFPGNITLLASKATATGVYFLYRKEKTVKGGTLTQYRLINMVSGQDRLVDSTRNADNPYAEYEIFPDENFYTTEKDNIITWHDLNTGYEFKNFGRDETSIVSIAYSPEGRYLAAANPSGKVMLWDLGTGKETKSLTVGTSGYITKLAFSGDGKYLAASSGDIWETASGKNVVSVTDGSIWAVNSIDFSLDGTRIISGGACIISWDAADGSKLQYQQEPDSKDMDTVNLCWNRYGCVDPDYGLMVHSTAFHPNSKDFVTGNVSGIVQKWNTEDRRQHAYKIFGGIPGQTSIKVYDLKYTRDGNSVIALQQKCIYRLNGTTLAVEDSLILAEGEEILGIDMGYDGKVFGCITLRQNARVVQIRNIHDLEVLQEFHTDGASFNKISFSPNRKHAATASDDGFCTIWDLATGKPSMYLSTIGDYGNIMVTPDNFYMASKSALEGVTFFKDSSFYSFDQFDLYLNRPDIVLGRLGYASPELLNFYRNAYYKRLKKATGNVADTTMNEYVPALKLRNKRSIPPVTASRVLGLTFDITDSSGQKGSIRLFVNGNLVREQVLDGSSTSSTFSDSVILGQGINNIEALYLTAASIESRKEKVAVSYVPAKKVQPKVWFVGVGISKYRDADMNLKYPVKDIKDIARDFKKKYPGMIIDTLLNEKATKENILALRDKLKNTSVDDKVIVSFSGHGLLSDSLDWYFATWDVDFKKPQDRGLPYSMMEGLLGGIPARQKLLLMDACHSGEVDKESDITFANKETAIGDTVVTTPKGFIKSESKVGLQTSFELMQEMFASLGNGNGTTVLSAAGGKEYALESDTWKNGVFTYSLLKALKDPATDENGNKKISVKELKKTVFDSVKKLTGGRQKPTSRVEILDDWDIW